MINAEKYRDEILAMTNNHEHFAIKADNPTVIMRCNDFEQCRGCLFNNSNNGSCSSNKMKWLLSEYKEPIKLSRLEYEILKHVQKEGFNFIARNDLNDYGGYGGNLYGNLFIYETKPIKLYSNIGWCTTSKSYVLYAFNDLFQFVKCEDEQPTSIDSILNNCVVNEIKEEQ